MKGSVLVRKTVLDVIDDVDVHRDFELESVSVLAVQDTDNVFSFRPLLTHVYIRCPFLLFTTSSRWLFVLLLTYRYNIIIFFNNNNSIITKVSTSADDVPLEVQLTYC